MKKLILSLTLIGFSLILFGQFSSKNLIFSDRTVEAIAIGDIDNDGDADILSLNGNASDFPLGWQENLGFPAKYARIKRLQTLVDQISQIYLNDLNGDGNLDIVYVQNEIYWMPGFGDGTFDEEQIISTSFLTANAPRFLTDIDNDNDIDIVSQASDKITWLENGGAGYFEEERIMIEGLQIGGGLSFEDLDQDGDKDMILENFNNEMYWHENADTIFEAGQSVYSFSTLHSFSTADIDNDGDQDIAVMSNNPEGIFWMENEDSAGSFGDLQEIVSGDIISFPSPNIRTVDMDGDGNTDILSLEGSSNLVWYKNLDNGTSFGPATLISSEPSYIQEVYLGDPDNDNDQDILFVKNNGWEVSWFPNIDGAGTFSDKHYIMRKMPMATSATPADLDGDGDEDLLIASDGALWLENIDGLGNYGSAIDIEDDNTSNDVKKLFALDLDNDGDNDVVAQWDSGPLRWYRNLDGLGNFGAPITIYDSFHDHVCLADIDNDNDLDLIITKGSPYTTLWKENNNNGFGTTHTITSDAENFYDIQCADLDNDGDNDLIVAVEADNFQDDYIAWYENTGGVFSSEIFITDGLQSLRKLGVADVDLDGLNDIVTLTALKLSWHKNLNNGSDFAPEQLLENVSGNASHILLEDIDENGFVDILSSASDDGELWLYRNTGGVFDAHEVASNLEANFQFIATVDINNNGGRDLITITDFTDHNMFWFDNLETSLKIQGRTFWDVNENGTLDNSEPGLYLQNVLLQPDEVSSWSNGGGDFVYTISPGDYQLSCQPAPNWELTTDQNIDISISNNSETQNFGLTPSSNVPEAFVDLSSAATRCGFQVPFWINYQNTGTIYADGTITLELDDLVTFESADPEPDQINGNLLTWNFENLTPTYSERINLILQMPGVDNIGEIIEMNTNISLTDDNGGLIFTDNHHFESEINCAYDPNDKLVEPEFVDFENYELFGDTLHYTIRFQNTGTDTAFNVRLEDQLDPNLDWSTFGIIGSSHSHLVYLEDNGQLTFNFNNILLPDSSTNLQASQGFIKYKIQLNDGLPQSAEINNTANIFFDFNPPIQTNTVTIQLLTTSLTEEEQNKWQLSISPNPSRGNIQIDFDLTDKHDWQIHLYNSIGQKIKNYHAPEGGSSKSSFDIKNIQEGVYFLSLHVNNQVVTRKIMVIK